MRQLTGTTFFFSGDFCDHKERDCPKMDADIYQKEPDIYEGANKLRLVVLESCSTRRGFIISYTWWWYCGEGGPQPSPVSPPCTILAGNQELKMTIDWGCLAEGETDSCFQWVDSWGSWFALGRDNKSQLNLWLDRVMECPWTCTELKLWAQSTPWCEQAAVLTRFYFLNMEGQKGMLTVCNQPTFLFLFKNSVEV